ncbi:MAG TPA: SMI1/KNR4 family protein [Chloroflexia bacterium]|nr:SMI1/KNR4 family protein [Chloroflexia bacterium]
MALPDWIARLDSWLHRQRPDYYARLQPGLGAAAWPALEAALGLTLPADFQAFYAWRNGQAAAHTDSFVYNFMLMDAADIQSATTLLNELLAGGEFEQPNWWQTGWIPFLSNGGGDHYCLDLVGSFGGRPGQVLRFYHDWECRDIEYPHFAAWLETVVTAFERGLFADDRRYGMQPLDDAVVDALQRELNPGYPIDQEAG